MADGPQQQIIQFWSATEHNRLVGHIYNRPGHEDGELVITSPVVAMRFAGEANAPVAVTASGTSYCLGEPAEGFGQANAEAFVISMSRMQGTAKETGPDSPMGTTVIRLR